MSLQRISPALPTGFSSLASHWICLVAGSVQAPPMIGLFAVQAAEFNSSTGMYGLPVHNCTAALQ